MLRPSGTDLMVYLYRPPVDMRKMRNGLSAIVRQEMQLDPFEPAYFLFTNKKRKALKILVWDICGFALWHKVIESEQRFPWPRFFDQQTLTMTSEQLSMLMDGYDVWSRPHRSIHFIHAG